MTEIHRHKDGFELSNDRSRLDVSNLSHIPYWKLSTRDAHSLYERFGFKLAQESDMLMSLTRKPGRDL